MPNAATQTNQILNIESDVLFLKQEQYVTSSSSAWSDMLYINDKINNPNIIYKYNINTSTFIDTIIVDGSVRDINFY